MLAQLSDPHIRVGANDAGTARALEAAVRAVAALDPAPDAILLSGDVAEHADPDEYQRARELLAPLDLPIHALPGNHDDPDALRAAFPGPTAVRCGALRLVLCDSTVPGGDDGALGPVRLDDLERTLAADHATITMLAIHHPPIVTGVHAMDAIRLAADDRAALAELLTEHRNVRLVAAGHVHRTMVGRVGPCPVMTCPSVHLQLELNLRPDAPTNVGVVDEPPGFALHLPAGGEITSHVVPIGDFGPPRRWPS